MSIIRKALTTAAVARCSTPLSGPSQRSWLSAAKCRAKPPRSAVISSTGSPLARRATAAMAATTSSLPRPMVKVNPWPSGARGWSVRSTR